MSMTDDKVVPIRSLESLRDDRLSAWHQRMRTMLIEQSLHEKESEALFDEREFARRYAVSWSRRDREALLDFQREVHLSDQQIRWLNRSGSLKWHDGRIEVNAPGWIAWGGRCNFLVLWLIGITLLFGAHRHDYDLEVVVGVSIGLFGLLMATGLLWLCYELPEKIRAEVILVRTDRERY